MKYSKDPKCKKCGCNIASTEFVPSKKIYDSYNSKTDEYIKRICGCCGYIWREEPLDRD